MISKHKQYRTRDGREVRIYATDGRGNQPIHGACIDSDGEWVLCSWDSEGRYFGRTEAFHDLIEVKPPFRIERWVNVYSDPSHMSYLYKTKEDALRIAAEDRIATKRILIEGTEGEDDPEVGQ
jgi:hypothetical protein